MTLTTQQIFIFMSYSQRRQAVVRIRSLSTRRFDPPKASASCLPLKVVFTLLHLYCFCVFFLVETISLKIWERPLAWYEKCSACLSSLMSGDEGRAQGIVLTLFEFVYVWVFLFHAPSSSDASVLLLNRCND